MLKKIGIVIFTLFFFKTHLVALSGIPHDFVIDYETNSTTLCTDCHTQELLSNSSFTCLTCHDSVIAPDVQTNLPGSEGFYPTLNYDKNTDLPLADLTNTPGSNLDLAHSHPVDIIYVEGISNLISKSTPLNNWHSASVIDDILVDGKIACISCHSPHSALEARLRTFNKGSKMCISCHNK